MEALFFGFLPELTNSQPPRRRPSDRRRGLRLFSAVCVACTPPGPVLFAQLGSDPQSFLLGLRHI